MPVTSVPIHEILVQEGFNPRNEIEAADLKRLTTSIEAQGLLQPLIVRHDPKANSERPYTLIGGHRRLAALESLGVATVPVLVSEVKDEKQDLLNAVTENMVRIDLNPVEEAQAFRRLADEKRSHQEIANLLGVSQKLVRERLALLDLSPQILTFMADGRLGTSVGPALILLAAVSPDAAIDLARLAAAESLSPFEVTDNGVSKLYYTKKTSSKYVFTVSGKAGEGFPASAELQAASKSPYAKDDYSHSWRVSLSNEQIEAAVNSGIAFRSHDDAQVVLWTDIAFLDQELLKAAGEVWAQYNRANAPKKAVKKSDKQKAARQVELESIEAEKTTARNGNQNTWNAVLKAPALKLTADQMRLVARALIDPYIKEICNGLAISVPELAVAPGEKKRIWGYDKDKALDVLERHLAGGSSPEDVMQRALALLAVADAASPNVFALSSRPQMNKLHESRAGQVAHHLFSKAMPTGRKLTKIDKWNAEWIKKSSLQAYEASKGADA